MSKTYDVVIFGGGISGLSSAQKLVKSGSSVLLLEARDRLGGRLCTVKGNVFDYTDVGGAYIGPTQHLLLKMIDDLEVGTYEVHDTGNSFFNSSGRWFNYERDLIYSWNPFNLLDANHVIRTLDTMSSKVPCDAPWNAFKATEWDQITLREFLNSICYTNFAYDLVAVFLENVFAIEPHEISLLYFLWYIRSGQGLYRLSQSHDGAQELKFVGGAQTFCETLAASIDKTLLTIQLGAPVVALSQTDAGVTVTTADGTAYQAQYAISALPQPLISTVRMDPPLPAKRAQILQRMPFGSVIKTVMFYEKPYWREKGLSGAIGTRLGVQGYCSDDTRPDMKYPALVGFIAGDRCRTMMDLTEVERMRKLTEHYAEVFDDERLLKPQDYVEKNWCEEPFSRGCYVSIMQPGTLTQFGRVLRTPHDRLHFAGTETATRWSGYMDGGIQAGYRAAREVLVRLGRMKSIQAESERLTESSLAHTYQPFQRSFVERWLPSPRAVLYTLGPVLLSMTVSAAIRFYFRDMSYKEMYQFFKELKALLCGIGDPIGTVSGQAHRIGTGLYNQANFRSTPPVQPSGSFKLDEDFTSGS